MRRPKRGAAHSRGVAPVRTLAAVAGLASAFVISLMPVRPTLAEIPVDGPADLVLKNGDVYTGSTDHSRAQAIAIRGEWIVGIGFDNQVSNSTGPKTRVIDLHGAFVMPGFNDAHVHLVSAGIAKLEVDLTGTKSVVEFQQRIRDRLKDLAPGEWVVGRGWDHTLWAGKQFPTREALDGVSRDHPMIFERVDGHVAVANSRALEIAGIMRNSPDPPGGKFERDSVTGELTGLLEEDSAMDRVNRFIPPVSAAQRRRAIELALSDLAQNGVTSSQDNSEDEMFRYYEEFPDGKPRGQKSRDDGPVPSAPQFTDFRIYQALEREGKLTARITEWLPFNAPIVALEELRREGGTSSPWLKTGALKGFLDGSLGSRTAAMLAPYSDDPSSTGILRVDPGELKRMAMERDTAGFQIALHAIGDRANRVGLDAFAAVLYANGPRDRRDRIEHAQVLSLDDLPRFAAIGVIASMQPCHLLDDERWAESRIGPKRVKGAYAWKSLEASGARLAFGTDFPVESVNPLRGLYACITRELPEGGPAGGWEPQERLPIDTCIREYTIGAAYAQFEENRKGQLVPGMLADVVVFPSDITRVAPADLLRTKTEMTIVGGRVVYESHPH